MVTEHFKNLYIKKRVAVLTFGRRIYLGFRKAHVLFVGNECKFTSPAYTVFLACKSICIFSATKNYDSNCEDFTKRKQQQKYENRNIHQRKKSYFCA